ncbi:MAG TPA: ABC transporter substrate-binding protein [Chloroflexota bacterium]|jgi:ABC-type nitrate/sulfonate/bicarbonate transport system substrate-binding protein
MRVAIVVLAALALAACKSSAGAPAPPAAAPAAPAPAPSQAAPAATTAPAPLEHVRVAYATPSGGFAAPWMAKEAGLFEKYGLDADVTYIASGPTMIQSLLAGEIRFGELAAPSSMAAYVQGGEVVWISSAVNRPVLFVLARPEITSLADLRGKPAGVTRLGTLTDTFMRLALRKAGLEPDEDVPVLQTGGVPETVGAIVSGRISAGVFGPPNHLEALKAGMHILVDLGDLGIPWPFGGTVSTKSYLASNPETVRKYLRAYVEAVHLLRTDRERGTSVIAKYTNLDDRAVAEQTWEIFSKRYDMPPYPTREGMEAVVQYALVDTDPKAKDIPPQDFYDDRPLRELEQGGFVKQVTGS